MQKKNYRLPILLVLCAVIVAASAALMSRSGPAAAGVSTIAGNECPELRVVNTIDTTQLARPISVYGKLELFGEPVPLEDADVRERLERELQLNIYWHSNTIMAMKNANRYFGEIEQVLRQNEVHTDFKYLALIESGFRNEVSPAGAVGFWQILKETAKIYGLEVNNEVDERYNYEKATVAACKYLRDAKSIFGNWTLSAASYNLGMAGMKQRVADQKTSNFYEMYFNPETSRYIFRMLAMKIVFSQPEACGFRVQDAELYQPYKYKMVEVDGAIPSIADFAAQYNLKYKHIKILNPWLREASLINSARKKYQIKVMLPN
ncbi:MAG: lytic transglycosylase domain-containing protein [Bacteroidetes bacterium]|nr:lytic transglycosylase domain-containing protein [Bacteroidota bacterium]